MGAARTPARIDINCDMGEGFGAYTMGLDADIMPHISSANIACGFHAGDPGRMRATVSLAERHRVGVGAHPGFPDLRGFGRRNLAATPAEIRDDVVYQIGALTAFTRDKALQHVKPHGALYNMAVDSDDIAHAIADAIQAVDERLILVALAGSRWEATSRRLGLRVAREVFADRAFRADGTLVPRGEPGAVILDRSAVVDRSLQMVSEGTITAVSGETIECRADTICLHGDTPGAVDLASALRGAFERAGVSVAPLAQLIPR